MMASLVAFAFAVIGLSCYILIFFLYIPQLSAHVVAKLCNHIVFRREAHISIRSLRFIFLSGKVILKGLCYTTIDANLYVENLEITVLWWRALFLNRRLSTSHQQTQGPCEETPAAFIVAKGVQIRLVNQKARYDFIQKIVEQQTYSVDMQAPVSLLVEEFEGYSLWLYQYLGPIAMDLQYCSFVANDPAISDAVSLYFETGKGRYAAVSAPCPLDVYRSFYQLTMNRFEIQYVSVTSGNMEETQDNHLNEDNYRDVLDTEGFAESVVSPHSMKSYLSSSVNEEAEITVIDSPIVEHPYEETNGKWNAIKYLISYWMKFQRFMIQLFGYLDISSTDILPHHKFTLFEADSVSVEYHYDIPGITILSEGQTPTWNPPECLLKMSSSGTRFYYSPVLEKARCVLLERFFPPTFENFEIDTNFTKEGRKRRHRCFQIEMDCKAQSNQPMIYIIFNPRYPDNNRRSSNTARLNIWCQESLHLSLLYPYMISAGETEANLEFCANFDEVVVDLVQESTLTLCKAPMLTVEGKLGFPMIWNGYRKWIFDFRFLSSKWIFMREYTNVLSDILSEMSEGVTSEPFRSFMPTEYFVNLELRSGYSIYFSANPSNNWKNPSQMGMDNEWALEVVGNTLKMKFHLPSGLVPMPLSWDMNWLLYASHLKVWFHWPIEQELRKRLGSCQKIIDVSSFDIHCSHSYWNIVVPGYQDRIRAVMNISDMNFVLNPYHLMYLSEFLENYFGKHLFAYIDGKPLIQEYCDSMEQLASVRSSRETSFLMNIHRWSLFVCAGIDAAVKVPSFFSYLRLKIPYCSYYMKSTKSCTNLTLSCPRNIEITPHIENESVATQHRTDNRRLYLRGVSISLLYLFGNNDVEYINIGSIRLESFYGQVRIDKMRCFSDILNCFRLSSTEKKKTCLLPLETLELELGSLDFKLFHEDSIVESVVPSGLKVLFSNLQYSNVGFTAKLEVGLILVSLWVPTSQLLEESVGDSNSMKKSIEKTEYAEVASFSSRLTVIFRIFEKLASLTAFKQMEELKKADCFQRNIQFLWKESNEFWINSRFRRDLHKQSNSTLGNSNENRQSMSRAGASNFGEIPDTMQEFWMQLASVNGELKGECDEEGLNGEQNFSFIQLAVPESMKCSLSPAAIQTGINLMNVFMSEQEEHVELIVCKIWKEHLERCIATEEDTVSNYKFSMELPEVKVKIRKMTPKCFSCSQCVTFSSIPEIYIYLSNFYLRWSLSGSRSKAKEMVFGLAQILCGISLDGGLDDQSRIMEFNSVQIRNFVSSGKQNVNLMFDSLRVGDNLSELESMVRCCMLFAKFGISYWSAALKSKPKTMTADVFSLCVISGEASTGLVTSGRQVRKVFLSALARVRAMNQLERSRMLMLLQSSAARSHPYSSAMDNRKVAFELICHWNQFSLNVESVTILICNQIYGKYSCFSGRSILVLVAKELNSRADTQLLSKITIFVRECIHTWYTEWTISQREWTATALERMQRKTFRSLPEGEWTNVPFHSKQITDDPPLIENQISDDALLQSLSTAPFFFSSSRRVNQKNNLVSTFSAPWGTHLPTFQSEQKDNNEKVSSPQDSAFLLRSLSSLEAKTTWNELDIQPSLLSTAPILVDVIISVDKIDMQLLSSSTESVFIFHSYQNVTYVPMSLAESVEHSSILCSSEEMKCQVNGPNEEDWLRFFINTPQYVISLQHNGKSPNIVASMLAIESVSIRVEYSFFSAWHLFGHMLDELRSLMGDREVDARTASSQMYNIPPLNVVISECSLQLPLSEDENKLLYKVQDMRATSCELSHTENIIVVRVPLHCMEYFDKQIALDLLQLPSAVLEARITLTSDDQNALRVQQNSPVITHYRFHLAFKAIESMVTKERIRRLKNIFEIWNRPRKKNFVKPMTTNSMLADYSRTVVTRFFSLVISLQTLSLSSELMSIHSELFLDNLNFVLKTTNIPYPDIHITFRNIGLVIRLAGSLPSRFSINQFQSHIRMKQSIDSTFLHRLQMVSASSMKECELFMDKRCMTALVLLADELKYYECDEEESSTNDSLMETMAAAASRLCIYVLTNIRIGIIRMTFVVDNNYDIRISAHSPSLSLRMDNLKTLPRYRLVLTGSFESAHIYQQNTPILTFQSSCVDFSWLSGKVACFVDIGSYTLSLDHAIRLLPDAASEGDSAMGAQLFTLIDIGVNINAGVVTFKSTKYVDTDIQVPGMYCNLFLDITRLKAIFFCDWDYANIDFMESQLGHVMKWFFDRSQESRSQPTSSTHSRKSSGHWHRRMKTIASFASTSPGTGNSRKSFQWSLIVRLSRSYARLKESVGSAGLMMLSASVSVPEAQFLLSPGKHPIHGKQILLASGGVGSLDITLNPAWHATSQLRCLSTGIEFLFDLTGRTGTCRLRHITTDLELATLLSLQNMFQNIHWSSTSQSVPNHWEIQPLRKFAISICVQDWMDISSSPHSHPSQPQSSVKLSLRMVQQSSGSMEFGFHRSYLHFGYLDDRNFFYLNCAKGQIHSTRQHFHGKGGLERWFISRLSSPSIDFLCMDIDSFLFHLAQGGEDSQREEILKLACKQFFWKTYHSSEEVLRLARNAVDMDVWIKGLHGALCSTSSPALNRLKESLSHLLTETKRLSSTVAHTTFTTIDHESRHHSMMAHGMSKHKSKRLCIHGDHLMLSLFALHFHEQDFLRVASNQYRMTFSHTVDRNQGENRQLQVRFDTFRIQRESLTDPSSQGDILSIPNPNLRLQTVVYATDFYYDFVTDFDGPVQISSRVSQYRYMRHILRLYFSKKTQTDQDSLGPPLVTTMESRYHIHRKRLQFEPKLNALGELTPSLDMLLSWLGLGDTGTIPLLIYERILEKLDHLMSGNSVTSIPTTTTMPSNSE
ncbi:hypothetical protein GpartN1_g2932.t1 [Galdieria partita]|uniref:Fragile site-associated protein C-terminal domain-containing protein n=1 Tax=Galdieria partita TaxID=83374 RepID=A0A9C7UQ09_9RHOD|nr:hypothetical protein GpartN1_g2932.t1 [Galdieria partita]